MEHFNFSHKGTYTVIKHLKIYNWYLNYVEANDPALLGKGVRGYKIILFILGIKR